MGEVPLCTCPVPRSGVEHGVDIPDDVDAPALVLLGHHLAMVNRKVDIRLHGKGNSKIPWRKAGQPGHLVDVVDSDQ